MRLSGKFFYPDFSPTASRNTVGIAHIGAEPVFAGRGRKFLPHHRGMFFSNIIDRLDFFESPVGTLFVVQDAEE